MHRGSRFQHIVTSYASDTNNTVSVWRAVAEDVPILASPSPGVQAGKRCRSSSRSHKCVRRKFGSLAAILCCLPLRVRTTSVLSGCTATTRQNFSTE